MKTSRKINGRNLAQIRVRNGISQKGLAQKLGMDKGTVNRWETGRLNRVKAEVFAKLCAVLRAQPQELTTEAIPQPTITQFAPDPEPGQLNVTVEDQVRNAFSLVALRYGVSVTRQIELAPLLVATLAEMSLKQRRERIAELDKQVDGSFDEARETRRKFRHLPEIVLGLDANHAAIRGENQSIKSNDIFAEKIPQEAYNFSTSVDEYDDGLQNPFEIFLSGLAPRDAHVDRVSKEEVSYSVCRDDALALSGGDENLAELIWSGDVLLREIPRELFRPDRIEGRLEWLRDRYKEREDLRAQIAKQFAEAFPKGILEP